ncbi:MAG: transcription termination factor NusA, partial [SAR324 cluster bacterium]
MKENLFEIIKDFSKEKGLDHEVVIKLVEESLIQAAQRKLPYNEIEGKIDENTGKINLSHFKEVVEIVEDANNQISLDDVEEIDPEAGLGDEVEYEISDREFLRIAHSTRPIIFGSLKEAERQMVVSTFTNKVGDVLTGNVIRVEPNGRIAFSFQNKVEAYLFKREQIYGENFTFGDHVRVLLLDVNDNPHKDSQLTISRTHPGLLIKMFEMEVPEIFDGIVKIVNAVREPGRRAKISVYSNDEDVDPVGSCVGMRGSRVQTIVNDLNGEKIDIVRWSEDLDQYTSNALAPAEIESLEIDEEANQIDVIVAQNQLSLAIGHKGQNVRLASKLIGYKINIVANEVEELSIDEQLEKELAKTKESGEKSQETSAELAEENNSEESETVTEVESLAEFTTETDAPVEDEEIETNESVEHENTEAVEVN